MEPFDQIAAAGYQRVHGENPYERAAIAELSRRLPRCASVLDLGCGTGVPTARAMTDEGHRVLGVDTSSKMRELARKQVPLAMLTKQDMRDATFPAGEFDAVSAYFSLMMLSRSDISLILGRIRTWLKPDGLLSLSFVEFDADSVDVEFMGVRYPASGYSVEGLERLLAHHELSVLHIQLVQYQPQQGPLRISNLLPCPARWTRSASRSGTMPAIWDMASARNLTGPGRHRGRTPPTANRSSSPGSRQGTGRCTV